MVGSMKVGNKQVITEGNAFNGDCMIHTLLNRDEYKVEWIFKNNFVKTMEGEDLFVYKLKDGLKLVGVKTKLNHSGVYKCKVTVEVVTVLNDK